MSLFAIGDLHLSFSSEKPMDIYGGWWVNHTERVENLWRESISEEDTVIIAGDISWALKLNDAVIDLEWIDSLPGQKVMIKGNHDLWWAAIGKLNKLYDRMYFIQNTFYPLGEYAICGSRGWICPGENGFTAQDEKIYLRELGRVKASLEAAKKAGYQKVIGVLHFPPTNERKNNSGFTELFENYGVEKVIYGHLHGKDAYKNGLQGERHGVEYLLTSCDFLRCQPLTLLK